MTVHYLINNSGDSVLKSYSYSDGLLTLLLSIDEIESSVELRIKTAHLSFDSFYIEKAEEIYRTCRIELHELMNVLSVENGVYIPPNNFAGLMKEARLNYNLAYGKKAAELRYIFSLVGYGKLVSCLLLDLDCIEIMEHQ